MKRSRIAKRQIATPEMEIKTTFAVARQRSAPLQTEIAVHQFLDWLHTLSDPDEVLARAGLRREHLRVLEADDEVMQCIETRREAVLSTPWRFEPGQSRTAKRLTEMLEPLVETLIRGAWQAVPYGYSVMEAVYGRDLSIIKLDIKPFEWFTPTVDGGLIYLYGDMRESLDPRKFFLTVRNGSYRNPYGEALLSRLYWPIFFRSRGWRFWAQFLERFGSPMLIGSSSGGQPAADALADALAAVHQDGVVAVANGDTVTAVDAKHDGQQFSMFEAAIVRRVEKLILGQTLTSDVGGSGSYAAAKVHNEVRDDKRRADIRLVSQTIQKVVNTLHILHGMSGAPPQFVMQDDAGLEMERAQRDALLVDKKVLVLTEEYLLDRYDFNPGDFTLPPAETKPEAESKTEGEVGKDDAQMSARFGQRFTPKQQVIENGLASLTFDQPLDEDAIKAAIRGAESPDDLRERLAVLLQGQPVNANMQRTLERAIFAADIIGYAHAGGGKSEPEPDPLEQEERRVKLEALKLSTQKEIEQREYERLKAEMAAQVETKRLAIYTEAMEYLNG